MTTTEFGSWCRRLGLGAEAITIITKIRTSPAARRIEQNKQSVTGTYQSTKTRFLVHCESQTIELSLIYTLEHDHNVLEYYPQPSTLEISYLSADGRLERHRHRPDYFVIRRGGAGWIEVKYEDVLRKLSTNEPNRYQYTNDGWTCPPGNKYVEPLGLTYLVRSSAEASALQMMTTAEFDSWRRRSPNFTRISLDIN